MDMATTTMTDLGSNAALIRLMTWLSPAFPVGAFAYSGGLEKVIEDRKVTNRVELQDWLVSLGARGSLKTDAVLFALSYKADNKQALVEIAELAEALAGSAERHKETMALGGAFLTAAEAWPCAAVDILAGRAAYPVAAGAVAGAHNIGLEAALGAFLHSALSQLVSVAIRCGSIGQSEGVAVLADLEQPLLGWAKDAVPATMDDLGSSAMIADIASMKHETQTSRLFRS